MLKQLAMLTVATFLTGAAWAAQPNQATGYEKQPTQQSQPPAVLTAPDKQRDGTENSGESSADPPHWYATLKDADWWLVVAAFLTCGVVCWQSWETRKASQATRLAATAAARSANTYVSKERARVVVRLNPLQLTEVEGAEIWHSRVDIEVQNVGLSNAYVTRKEASLCIHRVAEPICKADQEWLAGLKNDIIDANPTPILSAVWFFFSDDLSPQQIFDGINDKTLNCHIWGCIEYETMGETWIRSFGCTYDLENAQLFSILERPDWTANKLLLLGKWKDDPDRKNGERKKRVPN